MLEKFLNIFRIEDLRKRIFFTLGLLPKVCFTDFARVRIMGGNIHTRLPQVFGKLRYHCGRFAPLSEAADFRHPFSRRNIQDRLRPRRSR